MRCDRKCALQIATNMRRIGAGRAGREEEKEHNNNNTINIRPTQTIQYIRHLQCVAGRALAFALLPRFYRVPADNNNADASPRSDAGTKTK